MKIELVIVPEAGPTPEAPQTFALGLCSDAWATEDLASTIIMQRGFSTPRAVLQALVECLTFAPPDMTAMEEGLSAVNGLIDRVTDIEQAITTLGERLNAAEDMLEQLQGPAQPAGGSRLLPPRPNTTAAAVARAGQPAKAAVPQPSIRQPRQTVIDAGFGAGGKIKGGAQLSITGGVGRPGMLKVTGVGADDDSGIDNGE